MAIAKSIAVLETTPGSIAGRITEKHDVLYIGADVPGGSDRDTVLIENIDYSQTPAQVSSFIGSAIRTRAASIGRTVPANQVLLPDITKA